ncbi:helix-turn-helix transcriptional regulator [Clostridium perfringens]|uniref:helix-turn-helix domain-containing protein n=1 Tax=Clostridium perfringens TaxID=1502 RepID=UPI0020930960|nr:helix-turn-helix transcriptional regulator [Clostridium perfringens]MCO6002701.1 helix-turn-helix transcriptional regulator [Clostridium perfringens]MCO7395447.1 helix-turn-helix transcriptional regulator [Clostridium perfringens]MCP8916403.1 helix-turn-helix transcriptional regulator [Clostridium perfringens]MCP8966170.1 helix-turn-helix transcriptional regulator [Clostridium perfringens]
MNVGIIELGEIIKNKRLELNYTTEMLAKELNKSTGFINNLENGKTDAFNINLLSKLCNTLNLSIPSLIPQYTDEFDENLRNSLKCTNKSILELSDNLILVLKSTDKQSFKLLIDKLNTEIEYFNKLYK